MTVKSGNLLHGDLTKRVAQLEKQLQSLLVHKEGITYGSTPDIYCSVPQLVPRELGPRVSAERARLIHYGERKWVNGTVLHYYFFEDARWGAGNDQKDLVREGFEVWKDVGIGLRFEEVSSAEAAEIRIGFQQGDGYWSYVGTDVLNITSDNLNGQ